MAKVINATSFAFHGPHICPILGNKIWLFGDNGNFSNFCPKVTGVGLNGDKCLFGELNCKFIHAITDSGIITIRLYRKLPSPDKEVNIIMRVTDCK